MHFIDLIEDFKEDMIKSTQEIVRIKSVEDVKEPNVPFGKGPYEALEYALKLANEMGFSTKNLDGYAGYAEFGEGNETVGVLVHLDVVPEGDGWIYPPYGGEIHDGKIFGRGTSDDKGPAIASLYAMKALKDSNVKLNKKIRIIFGTNEETGSNCMKYYFKHEKAPDMAFTPDADFPVIHGEKGIIAFDLVKKMENKCTKDILIKSIKGGNAVNMVPDSCIAEIEAKDMDELEKKLSEFVKKTGYDISIDKKDDIAVVKAKGVSAHGSTPQKGENAITYLMSFLGEIIDSNCDICDFINIYNEKIAFSHHGEKIGCALEDDISGKLIFNPGVIKASENEIRLSINVRYPIKSNANDVYAGIRKELEGTGIEVVEDEHDTKPLYIPKDDILVEKLMKVYREETQDMESEPIVIGGGTYARSMKNAVAFGPAFPGDVDVAHQANEYISIDHLMKITRIYAKALYELAK